MLGKQFLQLANLMNGKPVQKKYYDYMLSYSPLMIMWKQKLPKYINNNRFSRQSSSILGTCEMDCKITGFENR